MRRHPAHAVRRAPRLRRAAWVGLLACGAASAGPAAPGGYEEEVTVVAPSRLPAAGEAGDAGTTVTLDVRELAASGARTVQEALWLLPGVHLGDQQGNASQLDVSVRGLTATPVTGVAQGLSVFVDGVRVNEPAVEEVNFDLVPLAEVERIELVRGPHAVFGRNTLAGAILVTTRRGGDRPVAEVEVEGGAGERRVVIGRAGGPLGPADGYLTLSGSSDPGWREASAARGVRAFAKLGLRREDHDLALSYQGQVDRIEQPGSLPASMLREDRRQSFTPGDFFRPRLHLVTLHGRGRLRPGLGLAAHVFARTLDAEQFNASWISPDTRLFNRTRSVGGAAQLEHRVRLGALRSRLAAGAEATRNDVAIAVHEEPNAEFATSDGLPLPRLTSDVSDRQAALGGFLQEDLAVVGGPLAGLGATAALRWDRISHAIVDASPDDPGKANGDVAYARLVPAAGLRFEPVPGWRASASWTAGYRAPAFLELTCADPEAPCIGLQAGVAPDTSFTPLRAVRSRTLEAGVAATPAAGVELRVDAFRIDLRDDVFSVTAPGTSRVFFQNVGSTRRQGVEVAARAGRGPVELAGSWTWLRATFETAVELATPRTATGGQSVAPGDELPLTPRHLLDLGARVRPWPWLALSGGVRRVGSQVYRGHEANEAARLPAYVLVRAGAEARWRTWTAFVRAANLLDARHETTGTWAVNGRAAGQPAAPFSNPGLPRRVVLGLRWELE